LFARNQSIFLFVQCSAVAPAMHSFDCCSALLELAVFMSNPRQSIPKRRCPSRSCWSQWMP
jgi:hypothetical protein